MRIEVGVHQLANLIKVYDGDGHRVSMVTSIDDVTHEVTQVKFHPNGTIKRSYVVAGHMAPARLTRVVTGWTYTVDDGPHLPL